MQSLHLFISYSLLSHEKLPPKFKRQKLWSNRWKMLHNLYIPPLLMLDITRAASQPHLWPEDV